MYAHVYVCVAFATNEQGLFYCNTWLLRAIIQRAYEKHFILVVWIYSKVKGKHFPCACFWENVLWGIPKIAKWTNYEGRSDKRRFEGKNIIYLHMGLGPFLQINKQYITKD